MKNIFLTFFLLITMILISGCSFGKQNSSSGSFMKSNDGGITWEGKTKINEKISIGNVNVLSMAIDSVQNDVIYLGTEKNGLFVSEDGAETWKKLNFSVDKIYGIAVDPIYSETVYASAIWQGRGKIFKSENRGKDWKEIYSEPANGTLILSLAISKRDPFMFYAGTSEGMILQTTDGGKSWKSPYKASGPIISIVFDSQNENIAYYGVFNNGIVLTKDKGKSFTDITMKMNEIGLGSQVYSLAVDSQKSGVLYAGLEKGILKISDFGEKFEEVKILETSKKSPIRGIAINPQNSKEIIYSSAQALYKSGDGGNHWSTFQLQNDYLAKVIKYSPNNPNIIYLGLSKKK